MKKKQGSFIVFYSQSCTPHIATFKSYSAAKRFVAQFHAAHIDNLDDNWVDCIVDGDLKQTYEGWDSYVVIDKRV